MKEACFDDYDIKMHGGNIVTNIDYEENILKMRVAMRKISFLSKPLQDKKMLSMQNMELNPQLTNIFKLAQKQKQDDVMNVIRHNDFNFGYSTSAKIDVLKNKQEDKLGINFETQLEILIASEENPELRENLKEYCQNSRKHPDFDEEKIVDDILSRNFSYL